MENNNLKGLQYFTVICNVKNCEKIITLLQENKAHCIEKNYGHSSVHKSILAQALGFEVEARKVVLTCLLPTYKAVEIINILNEKFNFKKPNTGIAFSVTVEGISF